MSLGIPKTASHQLVVMIGNWENKSGVEWTVERLKEVKLIYLHKLAGTTYTPKHWIKLKGGIPAGPLRVLFHQNKNFSKALTALMAYSAYVSQKITPKQREKFLSSMESEDETGMNSRLKRVKPSTDVSPSRFPTLVEYCTSSKKRGPGEWSTCPEMDKLQMFLHGAKSDPVRLIVARHEEIFRKIIPTDIFFNVEPHDYEDPRRHTLGRISAIQEPGFKLRAIANPSRVLQCALEPLKAELGSQLRRFDTDFTFNQGSAIPVIQGWIRQNRVVYSVDLSDATNLFPWPLQRELLQDTFTNPEMRQLISIMDQCAGGPWENSLGGEPICRFSRGQPLGLGPSFFTFAFAHNTLLQGICERRGIEPRFCVLGDDVVIGDRNLHRIYRETLNNLGCKVSDPKTFKSKDLAEFAGYVILRDRVGKGFKWRAISNHSFLDACTNLGKGVLSMLNKEQRRVAEFLGPIPKPLGGMGWSDGKTLDQFFASNLADPVVRGLIERSSKETTVVFRNLDADLRRFIDEVSRHQVINLAEKLMSGESWRQLSIPDFIDVDPSRLRAGPDFKVGTLEEGRTLPDYQGYYPVIERDGDPRPTALHLIVAINDYWYSGRALKDECYKPVGEMLYLCGNIHRTSAPWNHYKLDKERGPLTMTPEASKSSIVNETVKPSPSKEVKKDIGRRDQGISM